MAQGFDAYELLVARRDSRSEDERWHLRKDGTRVWVTGSIPAIKGGRRPPAGLREGPSRQDGEDEVHVAGCGRRASDHGLAFNGVPPYPVDPESLAHRGGVVAASEGWCPEYSRELYRRWFLEHKAPGEAQDLRSLIATLGRDPEAVLARADTDDTKARLMAETDVARGLGIFRSPTFAEGAEIFWGDDRLESALAWARDSLHADAKGAFAFQLKNSRGPGRPL